MKELFSKNFATLILLYFVENKGSAKTKLGKVFLQLGKQVFKISNTSMRATSMAVVLLTLLLIFNKY